MRLIPLLVLGAVVILLIVRSRRTRTASTASRSPTYGGDAWTPMMWSDRGSDSQCDSTDAGDCTSGGDAGCDAGGGGGCD